MNTARNEDDDRKIINFLHIDCIRNYAIHKAINDRQRIKSLKGNFWRVTANSTLDYAIIQWCMLFGTDKNSTHWKKQNYITCFEDQILKTVGMTNTDWKSLHSKIVEYRNKNAAHIDLDNWRREIPVMTEAIRILSASYMQFNNLSSNQWNLDTEFNRIYLETNETINCDDDESL